MNIKIDYLKDHQDKIGEISKCLFDEWSHLFPDKNIHDVERSVGSRIHSDKTPFALIAIDNCNNFIGTISLKEFDLDIRKDISPWLASFYVKKEFRNQGIGKLLLSNLIQISESIGFKSIYLYTEKAEEFYLINGWKVIDKTINHNSEISIMKYSFKNEPL